MSTNNKEKPDSYISLSESSQIRTNLGFILTVLGFVGVGVLGWATLNSDLASLKASQSDHKARMDGIETTHAVRMSAMEADWRTIREVLIRIDERTEQIKRDQVEIKAQLKK